MLCVVAGKYFMLGVAIVSVADVILWDITKCIQATSQAISSLEFVSRFWIKMPITKHPKKCEPLWKEWDYKAQKKGVHHTVYSVNGDQYTGEWNNNKKNGM